MGNGRFRSKIQSFMAGRYGVDQFSRFLSIACFVCLIIALIINKVGIAWLGNILMSLAFFALFWSYIRMFSRNYSRRQAENVKYLKIKSKFTGWFKLQKDRMAQRKDYVFYRCPDCKTVIRVPKGKGKVRIKCKSCGYTFERKT